MNRLKFGCPYMFAFKDCMQWTDTLQFEADVNTTLLGHSNSALSKQY